MLHLANSYQVRHYPFLSPLKKCGNIPLVPRDCMTETSQCPSSVIEEWLLSLPPLSPPLWVLFVSEGSPPEYPAHSLGNFSPGEEEFSAPYSQCSFHLPFKVPLVLALFMAWSGYCLVWPWCSGDSLYIFTELSEAPSLGLSDLRTVGLACTSVSTNPFGWACPLWRAFLHFLYAALTDKSSTTSCSYFFFALWLDNWIRKPPRLPHSVSPPWVLIHTDSRFIL